MYIIGTVLLGVAFVATVLSIAFFVVSHIYYSTAKKADKNSRESYVSTARKVSFFGYLGVFTTVFALTAACALIIYCFVSGDTSLQYVNQYHTDTTSSLALLYKVAGLWGGRQGSLLLWAWLLSAFSFFMAYRARKERDSLDNLALVVMQLVTASFVFVLLVSDSTQIFVPMGAQYFDDSGNLLSFNSLLAASAAGADVNPNLVSGMNSLLQHWAMAIHPPTLFVGYAGLTVPFAYAISALIVNDPSKLWVQRAQRYTLFAWVFLGIGIGLGAVWAYVVLGWGGYWGWDAVENASLLSWIAGVALIHSFTVYRQRNAFKIWAIVSACVTFAFVILGTYISRSNIVQSVHSFQGEDPTLVLFAILIAAAILVAIIGSIVRWRSFTEDVGDTMGESLASRGVMYFLNNVALIMFAAVIAYLTLASALPAPLPLHGVSFGPVEFNRIARPLTLLYCLLMVAGPLMSWVKTDRAKFFKKALVPTILSLIAFAGLMVHFFINLMPAYQAEIATGSTHAKDMLLTAMPTVHYIITIAGFLIACLIFFNSLMLLGKVVSGVARSQDKGMASAFLSAVYNRASSFGGFLSHTAIAVILVGLIGSSMYVSSQTSNLEFNTKTGVVEEEFQIKDYRLVYQSAEREELSSDDLLESICFNVYKDEKFIGQVTPGMHKTMSTQQVVQRAAVITGPVEDLFIVYNGTSADNMVSITGYVNPMVIYVWLGFGLLVIGSVIATVGRRRPKVKTESSYSPDPVLGAEDFDVDDTHSEDTSAYQADKKAKKAPDRNTE